MKKMHMWIGRALLLALLAGALLVLSGCSSRSVATKSVKVSGGRVQESTLNSKVSYSEMSPNDLNYYPDPQGTYWTNGGKTLVVEGAFYNFTSEFDVVGLKNCVIYMVDRDENIIVKAKVNESAVSVIPHNGSARYNLPLKNIPGGSAAYAANELFPRLETSFTYVAHEGANCSHCGGSSVGSKHDSVKVGSTCGWCGGEGRIKCDWCEGTGKNLDYDSLSAFYKMMSKRYCIVCDGKGYIECDRCHGSGVE